MYEFGKKILFLSFALLVGLMIAQRIFIQHLPEPQKVDGLSRADLLTASNQLVAPEGKNIVSFQKRAIHLDELSQNLNKARLRKGKPAAIISSDGLYFVDHHGYLVKPPDTAAKYDLPVVAGINIKVDSSKLKIISKSVYEALNLIEIIRKANFVIYNQLSEIGLMDSLGLVLYLSGPTPLTAVFGKGEFNSKVAYLATIIETLGQSDLLAKAAYLDFRHHGQVIVKKRG